MPAVAPYIPVKQAAFSAWLANFSSLITASPLTYGLTSADAVTIAGWNTSWVAAMLLINSPSTKTAQAVSAKNTLLASIMPALRTYAQQIANAPGVTSANKIALGLNPKTSTPSPITAPTSTPVLVVQQAQAGSVTLRYRDSVASPSVKSKPYGVIHVRIFGKVSVTPITDATQLLLMATPTKSPFNLSTSGLGAGGTLYLAALYATRKGLVSGWSPIISTTVV